MAKAQFARTFRKARLAIGLAGLGLMLLEGCSSVPAGALRLAANSAAAPRQAFACLHDTGTRVKVPPGECVNVPGRSYSKEDLDRTGQIDTLEALRRLDPAIR